MPTIRVLNRTRGTVLGTSVRLADQLAARVRGFLFRPAPAVGEGILLSPCKAVHMFGVGFPLDVIFISEAGEVVATYRDLAPWRRSRLHGSALHALELPAGTIRATGTMVGDALSWATVDGAAASTPTPTSTSTSTSRSSKGNGYAGVRETDQIPEPTSEPGPEPVLEGEPVATPLRVEQRREA
jgi:uncharacterized protein